MGVGGVVPPGTKPWRQTKGGGGGYKYRHERSKGGGAGQYMSYMSDRGGDELDPRLEGSNRKEGNEVQTCFVMPCLSHRIRIL